MKLSDILAAETSRGKGEKDVTAAVHGGLWLRQDP